MLPPVLMPTTSRRNTKNHYAANDILSHKGTIISPEKTKKKKSYDDMTARTPSGHLPYMSEPPKQRMQIKKKKKKSCAGLHISNIFCNFAADFVK